MVIAINSFYCNGNIHCMDTPGSRLRALRKQKGLSQVQLSALVGIDQSTISDIENGGGLSAEYMMRLCEALNTTPQYVMRGKSDADDLLRQIKQLVSAPAQVQQNDTQVVTRMDENTGKAQDEKATQGTRKVSLASSQQEPKPPKGANLGTFGGMAPAKSKESNANYKASRVRK